MKYFRVGTLTALSGMLLSSYSFSSKVFGADSPPSQADASITIAPTARTAGSDAASTIATATPTATAATSSAENDVVLSALGDELQRSLKELHLDEHASPYFISYDVREIDEATCSSCLGAEATMSRSRERMLIPVVRVGDYEIDSSYPSSTRHHFVAKMPVDDDYSAIRRLVWLNTDHAYKSAIRNIEWKKAYLASNNAPDRLPDMTHESAVVSINPTARASSENGRWTKLVEQLSGEFKKYQELQKSKVTFISRTINTWYINSEGTKIRDSRPQLFVKFWATAQSTDGMPLVDYEVLAVNDESKFPSFEELKKVADDLGQRLTDLRVAKKGEEYCGPVLVEGQAAAELIDQVLAPNFGFAEEYIGTEHWRNPLKNALGRKVLPTYMSVVDDPAAKDAAGKPLFGTYRFDDEGVPARKVSIVENGILKAFCQSRLPVKHSNHSNGHSLGGHGVFKVLALSSSKTLDEKGLLAKLGELAKDAGLDYVLVVSRMKDDYQLVEYPSLANASKRPYATPSYSMRPSDPVVIEKLYLADGHRELLRGMEFRAISLRAFRDIQACGDNAKPYLVEPTDCDTRALVTPSFVIGELELTPVVAEHSAPPILPSPVKASEDK